MESSGRSTPHRQEFHQAKASDESNSATGHTVYSERFFLLPENLSMSVFSADIAK